jgi:hypothetical protein
MAHHFAGVTPGYPRWLADHPDDYVLTVKLPFRPADMPRRPDGSPDIEAFPEKIFGPEHVIRHLDGSSELVDVPEWKHREIDQRMLHRATCETIKNPGDRYQMIGGPLDELTQLMEEYDKRCPACL